MPILFPKYYLRWKFPVDKTPNIPNREQRAPHITTHLSFRKPHSRSTHPAKRNFAPTIERFRHTMCHRTYSSHMYIHRLSRHPSNNRTYIYAYTDANRHTRLNHALMRSIIGPAALFLLQLSHSRIDIHSPRAQLADYIIAVARASSCTSLITRESELQHIWIHVLNLRWNSMAHCSLPRSLALLHHDNRAESTM